MSNVGLVDDRVVEVLGERAKDRVVWLEDWTGVNLCEYHTAGFVENRANVGTSLKVNAFFLAWLFVPFLGLFFGWKISWVGSVGTSSLRTSFIRCIAPFIY